TDFVGAPGALVFHDGVVTPVVYPGQTVSGGRVKGIQLGQPGRFLVAPPALAPDGSVVVFAALNGGSSEGIFRAAPPYATLTPLVVTDGLTADATPAGGTDNGLGVGAPSQGFFAGAPFSVPHLNDAGDVVFAGFVAGGPSSAGIFRARG